MLLKIDDTVLRAEFRAELIVDFMVLNTLDTVLRAEFTLLLIVLVIVFQILEVTELIAFHAALATLWIALVTELTTARAASILLLIAPFMLSQIVEAVVLIALQIVLATLLIAVVTAVNVAFAASILLLIQPPIASSAPDTVDLILSQIGIIKSLQFCQINWKGRVMIWKAAFRISPSAMTPTCTTFLIVSHVPDRNEVIPFQIFENVVAIVSSVPVMKETIPSHIPVKNEAIPFQIPSKKSLTALHASSQLEPNQPRTVSASPLKVSIQFVKVATTKSQTPPKISPAPCQTRSQSPVNIPANTSKSPTSTSSTTPRILLICWNTPSNTGASSSQKPFQTALSTSVMSSNSKPSSLSRSVIACPNSSNLAFIPSQIAVILFLNSSLFFQRFAKARISAAMAAPTASAGADMPPMAPITP